MYRFVDRVDVIRGLLEKLDSKILNIETESFLIPLIFHNLSRSGVYVPTTVFGLVLLDLECQWLLHRDLAM